MKHNPRIKACALIVFVLFTVVGRTQTSINNYKYVIVPERFSFSKEDNQYSLNSTVKFLLDQKGFSAFLGNRELPSMVVANRCNALTAELVQNSGMFVTKLTLLLKDCQGNIIFKSKEGKSREKEFSLAYNQALRDAFSSLDNEPYKYDSTEDLQQQHVANVDPSTVPTSASIDEIADTLYAQGTTNGYQLVDMTPKKVLVLFKTSVQDYFIAEAGAWHGIVFKKEGKWIFEYYKNDSIVSRELTIKF